MHFRTLEARSINFESKVNARIVRRAELPKINSNFNKGGFNP